MPDKEKVIEVTSPPETPQAAPVAELAATTAPAEPTRLSESEVSALLEAEKRLPAASRERLAKGQYLTADEVKAAITDKLLELKDAVGSGQPFGLGAAPAAPKKSPDERLAEANQELDRVNAKFGMSIYGGNK
jgi:hypothetical protein